jgi:hypothetical protein
LATILYIAERLNVPVGFLLAEEGDEVVYQKINNMSNIKKAYAVGDWQGCRSLCLSGCPEPDDEICLLLAKCDTEIAVEEFCHGRLHSSCRFFDEALLYAAKTMYVTAELYAKAGVYFRMMQRVSPTLYSNVYDEAESQEFRWCSAYADYVAAMEALDNEEIDTASRMLASMEDGSFYAEHIHVRLMIAERRYDEAKERLLQLLEQEMPPNVVELYFILSELEICCRETDDFKGAYKYTNEKIQQLEQLLREI